MTWSANLKVQDVSEGPGPINVLAVAEGDMEGSDGTSRPRVTSNTEGPVRSVEVKFVIDADETTIAIGDEMYASGHFTS